MRTLFDPKIFVPMYVFVLVCLTIIGVKRGFFPRYFLPPPMHSALNRLRYRPEQPRDVWLNLDNEREVHVPLYYLGRIEGKHLWYAHYDVKLEAATGLHISYLPNASHLAVDLHDGDRKAQMRISNPTPIHKIKDGIWTCLGCGVQSPDPCNCNCHAMMGQQQ